MSTRTSTRHERIREIKQTMLYALHAAQQCCPACTNCRDKMIDAITEYARRYAAVLQVKSNTSKNIR